MTSATTLSAIGPGFLDLHLRESCTVHFSNEFNESKQSQLKKKSPFRKNTKNQMQIRDWESKRKCINALTNISPSGTADLSPASFLSAGGAGGMGSRLGRLVSDGSRVTSGCGCPLAISPNREF